LKYDFFINPNLTDAELQVITNEARSRIVRLYADSYKRFFKGFQILQKIQANGILQELLAQRELGAKGQENTAAAVQQTGDKKSELEGLKWSNVNLREARVSRDIISQQLSRKSGSIARMYNELSDKLLNKGNADRGQLQNCLTFLNRMNTEVREPLMSQESFDSELTQRIENQLSQLNQYYETTINAKPGAAERTEQRQPQAFIL
jgi:hypothetical protein